MSNLFHHSGGVIYAGICHWYPLGTGPDLQGEAIYRAIIREVISRSVYLGSAFDALSYLDRSRDVLERFLAAQEVELRSLGQSEEEIARYKSLFIAEPLTSGLTDELGQKYSNMTGFAMDRVLNFGRGTASRRHNSQPSIPAHTVE